MTQPTSLFVNNLYAAHFPQMTTTKEKFMNASGIRELQFFKNVKWTVNDSYFEQFYNSNYCSVINSLKPIIVNEVLKKHRTNLSSIQLNLFLTVAAKVCRFVLNFCFLNSRYLDFREKLSKVENVNDIQSKPVTLVEKLSGLNICLEADLVAEPLSISNQKLIANGVALQFVERYSSEEKARVILSRPYPKTPKEICIEIDSDFITNNFIEIAVTVALNEMELSGATKLCFRLDNNQRDYIATLNILGFQETTTELHYILNTTQLNDLGQRTIEDAANTPLITQSILPLDFNLA